MTDPLQHTIDFITRATSANPEIVERIVRCYPKINLESREINEIITLILEGDYQTLFWLKTHEIPQFECQICTDEFKVTEMYTISCDSSHRFCYECVTSHVDTKLKEKSFINCPAPGCAYQMVPLDLTQIKRSKDDVESYESLLNRSIIEKSNAVACPGKDCTFYIYPSDESICEACPCPRCKIDFCSKCKREYHWRSDCTAVSNIEQRWLNWCLQGRQQHWQQKEQKRKEAYDQAKSLHEKTNAELKKRFEDLNKDEEYKKKMCKSCPNCGRIVEKLAGCDLMRCGTDYHGGNAQNGCGASFRWSNARPYVPPSVTLKQEEFKIPEPKVTALVVHEYYKCEFCKKDIVGLRFSCLNCKALDVCEECDLSGKSMHSPGHVFKIFTTYQPY
eukprot:TRINITY_DN14326_c0_g1_i1.p1 TRINITY_DN14326_c0_g1~~TRINITY_DN14326_c0_g1_i1.p1  ORF type:complete len:390 (-),score=25.57 TRINITY_DN14326_c0_g1_i1:99-1268(-)